MIINRDAMTTVSWFDTNAARSVVSLSKRVLVIPRKRCLRLDMTEKLLTGALNLDTSKQNNRENS